MSSHRFKLSVMMFLEFFIWGAWLPLIFGYSPSSVSAPGRTAVDPQRIHPGGLYGNVLQHPVRRPQFRRGAFPRIQPTSRRIGHSRARLGNGLLAVLSALMLVHCLFYVPTISITNSIAFANLKDPQTRIRAGAFVGNHRLDRGERWPFIFILIDWAQVTGIRSRCRSGNGSARRGHFQGRRGPAAHERPVATPSSSPASRRWCWRRISLVLPHTPPPGTGRQDSPDRARNSPGWKP